MGYTGGIFRLYAKITLRCHNLIFKVGLYNPERADHDTHPTAHAFVSGMKDICFLFFQIYGTGKACLNTRRFITVAALKGKGYMTLLLEYDS